MTRWIGQAGLVERDRPTKHGNRIVRLDAADVPELVDAIATAVWDLEVEQGGVKNSGPQISLRAILAQVSDLEQSTCHHRDEAWGPNEGCREFMDEPESFRCDKHATWEVREETTGPDGDERESVAMCRTHAHEAVESAVSAPYVVSVGAQPLPSEYGDTYAFACGIVAGGIAGLPFDEQPRRVRQLVIDMLQDLSDEVDVDEDPDEVLRCAACGIAAENIDGQILHTPPTPNDHPVVLDEHRIARHRPRLSARRGRPGA